MPPIKLIDLSTEILENILDFIYYGSDRDRPNFFPHLISDESSVAATKRHFYSIAEAIPQLTPLCTRYVHKRPPRVDPIPKTLAYFVFEKPELRTAVETLDLTGQSTDTIRTPEHAQPLLDYATKAAFADETFDPEQLTDWARLALQLLPGIKTLWFRESPGDASNRPSTIDRLLTHHIDAFDNLQHVSMEPIPKYFDFDLAHIITRLLDFPMLNSLTLVGFGHAARDRRRLLHTDVERPEELRPSRCVYFKFTNCYITRHELSIISARCKPRILEYQLYRDGWYDRLGDLEGNKLNREFLEGLAMSPSLARHLQRLKIQATKRPLLWTEHSTDLTPFFKLYSLHIPTQALVGDVADHTITISQLLPPSLEMLQLDTHDDPESEPWTTGWQLILANLLDRVVDILQNKPRYYPNLTQFNLDLSELVAGEIVRRKMGQTGRMAEALGLARANGVALGRFSMEPGVVWLSPANRDSLNMGGENLKVTINEDSIQAEVVQDADGDFE